MTETQWLQSTNPSELAAFLGERITDEQRRCFVEACRSSVGSPWSFRKEDLRWTELVYEWVTRAIDNGDISASLAADILRDIVGNPFRPMRVRKQCRACQGDGKLDDDYSSRRIQCRGCEPWGSGFNGNVELDLSWNDRAIPLMVDAMMNEECKRCQARKGVLGRWIYNHADSDWERCCCNEGRIPRAEPRWSDMLEIADALEESGCRDQYILEHLRSERDGEQCVACDGSGTQIRVYGVGEHGDCEQESCDHCEGTGRIKRRHWRGCWAIKLLSQKSGSGVGSK